MLDLFDSHEDALTLLRFVEQNARVGLFAFDVNTHDLRWSHGMYDLLNLRPGSIIPTWEYFRNLVVPDDRMAPGELQQYIEACVAFEREVRVILHDGRMKVLSLRFEFLLDQEGRPKRILGLCGDITALRAEQILQSAKKTKFKNVLSGVAPVVWASDGAGMITQAFGWNDLTGRSDAGALGTGWVDAVHQADRDETLAAWREACEQKRFFEWGYRVATPNGRFRRVRAIAARNVEGGILSDEWSGILVDLAAQPSSDDRNRATGAQIRAARGLLRWSIGELEAASGVSPAVIRRIEQFDDIPPKSGDALIALMHAMSAAGVDFTFFDAEPPGVRPTRRPRVLD